MNSVTLGVLGFFALLIYIVVVHTKVIYYLKDTNFECEKHRQFRMECSRDMDQLQNDIQFLKKKVIKNRIRRRINHQENI